MKKLLLSATSSCLLILITCFSHIRCEPPLNCIWGAYGTWSECDGCTNTQVRTRAIQVYPQFGGSVCSGEAIQRQACVPTKSCPLEAGCGSRFRCTSGQCISSTLVCNGDHDCQEDGLDEQGCAHSTTTLCNLHKTPPNSDLTGHGVDVLTGKLKAVVINTRSFGGQCRKVFSGDHSDYYRLPQSILRYSFQVAIDNDFSDEFYNSSWSYIEHVEQRKKIKGGHDHKTFHKELKLDKAYQLLIIKNELEVVQFQNNDQEYLPLSEEFWRALSALPSTYDPAAYRSLLQLYGTHYMTEGSLGGQYQVLLEFDSKFMSEMRAVDGGWNCWSSWETCSQGHTSRTRTCNNPAPENGGKHCVGPSIEHKPCKNLDLAHIRLMEPHCFKPNRTPVMSCKDPPNLTNGFVLRPKDIYRVGNKIEYTCIEGYFLVGDYVAECTGSLDWKRGHMECKRTSCDAPQLSNPLTASPVKQTYSIGETVSLSCPDGMQLVGQKEIICRSSLSWSPVPNTFKCNPVVQVGSSLTCRPWEKPGRTQCVCKMPYECGSSLQVCASVRPGLVNRMGLCQLGALQCLGRKFSVLQDTTCEWPETKFTSCQDCRPWEECNGVACNCKDPEDCPEGPAYLCVSVENGEHEIMTECETGAWRCSGRDVKVINIGNCQANSM